MLPYWLSIKKLCHFEKIGADGMIINQKGCF